MADLTPLEDLAVNDRFWLGEGRKIVESRVTRLEDAAGKLTTAIGWFWSAYTAAAVVGVSLTDRNLGVWALAIIALPSAALIVAYWLATWTLMPVYTKFVVNAVEDIEAELTRSYSEKRNRLGYAFVTTTTAAILLVIAVAVTAAATPKTIHSFSAAIQVVDGAGTLAVDGRFPANQAVTVTIEPLEKPSADAKGSIRQAAADGSGQLDLAFALQGTAASWKVTASWTENNAAKTETIMVAPPVTPALSPTIT